MRSMTSELTVTDLFCGAGGSSSGIAKVPGVRVVMAANHWRLAVDSHNHNHPETDHDCADLSQVHPSRFPSTTVLWASPSCTNHSIASAANRNQSEARPKRGELYPELPKEADERSRATMWDVVRFAEYHQYEAVIVENVVDAAKWVLIDAWLMAMRNLGYKHETVYLNSMFAGGTPQSRDRVYFMFYKNRTRRTLDVQFDPPAECANCGFTFGVQSWKKPNAPWGRYRQQYVYRCRSCNDVVEPFSAGAFKAIDWSIPGQRIGDRARPLAKGTMRRIEAGRRKYWAPLLVPVDRNKDEGKHAKPAWEPFPTQTGRNTMGLAMPFIAELRGGGSEARTVTDPMCTVTASGNHHGLTMPPGFVMRNNGSLGDGKEHCTPFWEPLRTLTTMGHQSVVLEPMTVGYNRTAVPKPVSKPMNTITTVDGAGLITPTGIGEIEDCTFRMLEPHEVQAGMAFEADYVVLGTKRERVKQLGNAVTPPAAQLLMERVAIMLGHEVSQPLLAAAA